MALKLGEYTLRKPIGRGAMGQVWLARQESLDRLVAVKVLPKELAKDESFLARFRREAKVAASMIHPNVIQIYSFGIEADVPYFAMEFVEGEDLAAKIKKGQGFSVKEAVRIVAGVARALECAQEKGMVHRDIKPANIMIAKNGTVKVMDFGLAKAASVRSAITQAGLIMGTPTYMSPEQGKGRELDVRSDMYSLGIVLYKLLTGDVPFEADTPTAVIFRHIYDPPRPPRELNPDVPGNLEKIVLRLLEKKPEARYATPSELLADLEAFLGGATTSVARPAVSAGPEQTVRTEAIVPDRTPTSVTEPLMAAPAEPAEATQPLSRSTEAAGAYVTTEDEALEFLEDLVSGEDPAVEARAGEVFEKNPGLRGDYAKQLFVHSLLRSQIDQRDRVGRGKRVMRVLSVVGTQEQPVSIAREIRSGPSVMPRTKSPALYYALCGAAVLVVAAVVLFLYVQGAMPEAEAVLDTVRQKSYDNKDRDYKVTLKLYDRRGNTYTLTGDLSVRNGDMMACELTGGPGGRIVVGSDGRKSWVVPAAGPVYAGADTARVQEVDSVAAEIPPLAVEDLLVRSGEFAMRSVGEEGIDWYGRGTPVMVRCTAAPSRTQSRIQEVTYWVDKERGLLVKLVMNLLPGPGNKGHRELTIEYAREEPRTAAYYSYGMHSYGRNLFQGGASEPPRQPDPFGPGPGGGPVPE
jgi:predicted Ser/Thr protein kinase